MTVWSFLLTLGIGAALGGCVVWFECCAGYERRVQMQRDARLRVVGVRPFGPPRSNCRRLDDDVQRQARDRVAP